MDPEILFPEIIPFNSSVIGKAASRVSRSKRRWMKKKKSKVVLKAKGDFIIANLVMDDMGDNRSDWNKELDISPSQFADVPAVLAVKQQDEGPRNQFTDSEGDVENPLAVKRRKTPMATSIERILYESRMDDDGYGKNTTVSDQLSDVHLQLFVISSEVYMEEILLTPAVGALMEKKTTLSTLHRGHTYYLQPRQRNH